MLIEYEKGLPKKAETPQVMMIKGGKIQKSNKNSLKAKGKGAKHNLDCTYLWRCRFVHISKKRIEKLQQEGLLRSTDGESFDQCESCLSGKMTRKSFPRRPERAIDLLGIIHTNVCSPLRHVSRQEVEEHSLRDLNEPASYKDAMLDSESNKWIDAMDAEIQFMIDNMVWVLVDLPPGCKIIGSEWIFKKKTSIDGTVHTYKARLVAKGYTQLYRVDYEETFTPIADIRAIRILVSIAAYYDYEIWQIDVKTAFLNGYLNEDIYMVQPEGFVDPNHPRKRYKMDNSKRGHIPMQERLDLNKTQGASTPKEVKRMHNVPYASAVSSIMETHYSCSHGRRILFLRLLAYPSLIYNDFESLHKSFNLGRYYFETLLIFASDPPYVVAPVLTLSFGCQKMKKLYACDSRNVVFNEMVGEPFVVVGTRNPGVDNFNLKNKTWSIIATFSYNPNSDHCLYVYTVGVKRIQVPKGCILGEVDGEDGDHLMTLLNSRQEVDGSFSVTTQAKLATRHPEFNAIASVLLTENLDNSLSMGNERLITIPETESDEELKSSVKDLVLISSDSKGISDDTCDVPFCDNSPSLDLLSDHS
nr:retrotransposon protein, putative, Ty1-copia subclass [Tanacetum cinerariifolium]